jgi:hypothetical protein
MAESGRGRRAGFRLPAEPSKIRLEKGESTKSRQIKSVPGHQQACGISVFPLFLSLNRRSLLRMGETTVGMQQMPAGRELLPSGNGKAEPF